MRRLRYALVGALLACLAAPSVSTAQEQPQTQHVTHRGYDVEVPASWRVVDLEAHPTACILFDTPTVYVGRAGEVQDCPAHAVGGAPGLWIRRTASAPDTPGARVVDHGAAVSVRPDAGGESHLVVRDAGVVVSAFGGRKASSVLETAALTPDARRSTAAPRTTAEAVTLSAVKLPGTFRGRGFDACTAPGGKVVNAWRQSTNFRSIGIYIGGISRACAQPKLSADWVRKRVNGGWHPLPIFVGRQAPCEADRFAHTLSSDPTTARTQGRHAANAAVDKAKALGIGAHSVLYYDMEGYNNANATCRRAVLNFLSAWVNQLRRQDYRSGVYSSISSGIADLSDTYNSDKYARPNHIWPAWWNRERNLDFTPYVPDGQWNNRQRVHQFRGGHNETHGGYTLNIDTNWMSVH
ncbi:DUF1906 domain-containing protein [Streptomyces sp. TR06-5]|uniref:DUF1906 domain-containing protein n=1 Tax=unclassified Streptomyces TaxID=2593676 RepID=UPI0039A25FD8